MDLPEFEAIIDRTMAGLPVKFRRILKKERIQVLARERMPAEVRKRYGDEGLFGIFVGVPYDKRSVFNVETEPTRIELYLKTFKSAFTDRREMQEQIAQTVIHEIGHYFGFSEKDLRRRSL